MTQPRELTDKEKLQLHRCTNDAMRELHKKLGTGWREVVLEMHKRVIADAFKDKPGSELNSYFNNSKKMVKDTIGLILAMEEKLNKDKDAGNKNELDDKHADAKSDDKAKEQNASKLSG